MGLFSLEAGPSAYRADFWVYGAAVPLLAAVLVLDAPPERWPLLAACAAGGLASWSLAEYALHRIVLHGIQPFERWHGEHHRRPRALIGTPTVLSAALFAVLVFLPAQVFAGPWPAAALTLGMLAGYLAYVVTHFWTHHAAPPPLAGSAWLRRHRHWHALHHGRLATTGCYGVTSRFWDRVFRSGPG